MVTDDSDDDSPRPKESRAPLDPILTLQLGGEEGTPSVLGQQSASLSCSVTSVCFVAGSSSYPQESAYSVDPNETEGFSDDDSSDDSFPLQLRSQQLVQSEARSSVDPTLAARLSAAALSASGRFLASCQTNGDSFLWDLGRKCRMHPFSPNRGPGLLLRRVEEESSVSRILYQSRDERGTVSLHDLMKTDGQCVPEIASVETCSRTFCVASPCKGNPNLVALPSQVESVAVVHDWRTPEKAAFALHGAGLSPSEYPATLRGHGMLTSLAFVESSNTLQLACGMDSGTLFFHDLRMIRQRGDLNSDDAAAPPHSSMSLSKDPILSLDMAPSIPAEGSFLTIAGLAGDAAEQSEMKDPGTVAIVKSTYKSGKISTRLRGKLSTCQLDSGGKPGVSICRFRPTDGRLFAVGGWDYRLRIFDRASAKLIAILRGHTASVQAMDWSSDASNSGLLATGGSDGRIHLWRCFSHGA